MEIRKLCGIADFDLGLIPHLALAATILAGFGIVLRAGWTAFAAAAASLLLVGCAVQLGAIEFRFEHMAVKASLLFTVVIGALSAAVTSVLSWQTARSRLGTLRSILT